MKREKYTVCIEVSMNDEAGDLAGEMRAGEERTVSACGEHIADAVDLQARLQSAYQHWLNADDATLTDACEQALEIAAAGMPPAGTQINVRNESSYPFTFSIEGTTVIIQDGDDDRYDGIARAMKGISADDMATGLDRMSEHMGVAAEVNDPRTEKLAGEAVGGLHVADLKARVEELSAANLAAFCAANRPNVDNERALKDVRSALDNVTALDRTPIVRTQDNVQVGDVRGSATRHEVVAVLGKGSEPVVLVGESGSSTTATLSEAAMMRLLNPTGADGKEASDGDE